MGLWKRRSATRDDPVFGRLSRDRGGWLVVSSTLGPNLPVVSIDADEKGPSDLQRSAYQQLQSQLVVLAEQLSQALYELYAPYLDVPNWEGPRTDSASHLRAMLELSSVRILQEGVSELLFAFKGDVWPDAMFVIEIRDEKVRGVSLDD